MSKGYTQRPTPKDKQKQADANWAAFMKQAKLSQPKQELKEDGKTNEVQRRNTSSR